MRFALFAVLAGMVALAPPQPTSPRAVGVLTGVVVDSSNVVVGGATVQLRAGTRIERATTTDARGEFRFENVLPGNYDVVVTKAGFAPLISAT